MKNKIEAIGVVLNTDYDGNIDLRDLSQDDYLDYLLTKIDKQIKRFSDKEKKEYLDLLSANLDCCNNTDTCLDIWGRGNRVLEPLIADIKRLANNYNVIQPERKELISPEEKDKAPIDTTSLIERPISILRPYFKFINNKEKEAGEYFLTEIWPTIKGIPINTDRDFGALSHILFESSYFKGLPATHSEWIKISTRCLEYNFTGQTASIKRCKVKDQIEKMKILYPLLEGL